MAALADEGVAVVFISSELEEVVRLSDRIVVLKDHRKIAEILNGPDVTAQSIVTTIAEENVVNEDIVVLESIIEERAS